MEAIELIIEKNGKELWGRVTVDDNLIVAEAKSIDELEVKLRKLIKEFHNLDNVIFERYYDVFALFEEFDFINITKFAKYADINASQLRQYASGVKCPREAQAKKIERAFQKLSEEVGRIAVHIN